MTQERQPQENAFVTGLDVYVELLTKLLGSIAGLVAVVYVMGFVITNTSLLQYGFFTLELFQAKYVASGFLFLILNLVILSEPLYDFTVLVRLRLASRPISKFRFLRNSLVSWLWCSFSVFVFSVLVNLASVSLLLTLSTGTVNFSRAEIVALASDKALILFSRLLVWSALVFLLFKWAVWQIVSRPATTYLLEGKKLTFKLSLVTFPIIAGFPWAILTIVLFSTLAYPLIPPSFGGGAPLQVQLLGDENVFDHFSLASIIDRTGIQREHAILSHPVYLIDETSSQYLLLTDGATGQSNSVAIDKNLVQGIIFPNLGQTIPTPATSTATPGP